MRRSLPLLIVLLVLCAAPAAAQQRAASLTVTAAFASRTMLRVSSNVLTFHVQNPDEPAIAALEFSAGARTRNGSDVVLSVEPLRSIEGPGGAADVETSLTFAGEGDGLLRGRLAAGVPAVAARWVGSGLRAGRLTFVLRAAAPGRYTLPVNFVLSIP